MLILHSEIYHFPLASKNGFSRKLLQPSTQQPSEAPPKAKAHPAAILRLPLFHWWGMKQLPTRAGCATLVMELRSFPLSEGLSRKRNTAAL